MEKNEYIEAGKIINTHGIAGEVKIEVWLDSPAFFKKFKRIFIDGTEIKVRSAREHKGFLIAALEGVADVNAAMPLKNKTVSVLKKDAKLPKGAFFIQDIMGAEVVDVDGRHLGVLKEVFETPANTIYVVSDGSEEHLVPAVPEFIMSTDAERGLITVKLIEGM